MSEPGRERLHHLGGSVGDPARARGLTRRFVDTVEDPAVDVDMAVLVMSELVAHAQRDRGGPVEVELTYDRGRVTVAVEQPTAVTLGETDRRHHPGLAAAGRAAEAWGWQMAADARVRLWCRLPPLGG